MAIAMQQLQLLSLPRGGIENRNLLVTRMKIAAYNLHKAPFAPASA
jgi:hypothetical protein